MDTADQVEGARFLSSVAANVLLDEIAEAIVGIDGSGQVRSWNSAAEKLTGVSFAQAADRSVADLPVAAAYRAASEHDGRVLSSVRHVAGFDSDVTARLVQVLQEGTPWKYLLLADQGPDERTAAELKRLALADHLTALPNRRYLEASLGNRLGELQRYGWRFGALMIDVDGFKQVNDTYGHLVGDEILREIATRLKRSARAFDTVGRWGGDEFVAVVANVGPKELRRVAERILHTTFAKVPGADEMVKIRIGASLALPEDDSASLLLRADEALYASKRSSERLHIR